ncbi:MAG: hypothetical protein ACLTXH_06535 [Enterobacter hormaechei]
MVTGFTVLYDVAWPLLTCGRHNVAPLYIMSYHSFLFKKAAIAEWFDFAVVNLRSRMTPEGADDGNLPANGERKWVKLINETDPDVHRLRLLARQPAMPPVAEFYRVVLADPSARNS